MSWWSALPTASASGGSSFLLSSSGFFLQQILCPWLDLQDGLAMGKRLLRSSYRACSTRWRNSANPALPYPILLISFSLFTLWLSYCRTGSSITWITDTCVLSLSQTARTSFPSFLDLDTFLYPRCLTSLGSQRGQKPFTGLASRHLAVYNRTGAMTPEENIWYKQKIFIEKRRWWLFHLL